MSKKLEHLVCPWWCAYLIDNKLRFLIHPPGRILAPYLKEGMTFIDIGCGMGFFSIQGAKIVKESGKVLSIDIQPEMLKNLETRAVKAGVNEIIQKHLAHQDNINLEAQGDFALAMAMVHETIDKEKFFSQVKKLLKPGSLFFIVEPRFHVPDKTIKQEIELAQKVGFKFLGYKEAGVLSKGMLFQLV